MLIALLPEELSAHPYLLIIVFVFAGILGGIVGYLMNNATIKWRGSEFMRSVMFGMLISGSVFMILAFMYSELFSPKAESMLNYLLAGCICFMVSVIFLMFGYRSLMRIAQQKRKEPPLRIKSEL
ncbi:MAG: hypothetical protein EOO50_15550 [Flavobacterium sp.]|uniref:YEATS-associated helix-containing protein n=1 Tax=Flavobacterium sp. TaxID=239 RepID=UPI0011FCDBCA|nr:YEATS-associated helix-containing protein [Flavobacterium sp.]RZJ64439.1 MAG: hypothetical protein EOO50_15550 [Flavobacterium sp.]